MKNLFRHLLLGTGLMVSLSVQGIAVWPPSTALSEEAAPASEAAGADRLSAVLKRADEIVDKLDLDERRLRVVLQRIENKEIKRKEHDDGHSLR